MATVENYVKPSRLFRYRSIESLDREIGSISEGYLYCAAYTALNDPMEGYFTASPLLRESKNHRAIRREIQENKARIGMCSFSEVHDHELMWAHYADQFSGICVEYSLARLLKNLDDDITLVRMFYSEVVPVIGRTKKDPGDTARKILSYKNYRWLYEREWRLFAPLGRANYDDVKCVRRVYLGSRIDAAKRERIVEEMKALKIPTFDMSIERYSISAFPSHQEASARAPEWSIRTPSDASRPAAWH